MKQVLLTRAGVEVRDIPAPQVEPGGILVRVTQSCISTGTEMSGLRENNLPLWRRAVRRPEQMRRMAEVVMKEGVVAARAVVNAKLAEAQPVGYSAVGEVIAVGGDVSDIAVGDRVACAGAQYAYHAEFISVPRNLCVAVPADVTDRDAATVTLGAIALQGIRRLQPTLGETIVVIGLGAIGLITAQLLKSAGARVIGIDIDRDRIDAAAAVGLDAGVHPDDNDPSAQIVRLTDGQGADGVIVTAASPSSEIMATAFRMCRRKARVILVGDVGLDLNRNDIYQKELDFLVSTSYGPGRYDRTYEEAGLDYPIAYVRWTENRNMAEYLQQIARGRVRLGAMMGKVYSVADAATAYAALSDPAERPLFAFLDYGASVASAARKVQLRVAQPGRDGTTRIALIGTGNFAKSMHLPLLQRMRADFKLEAVVGHRGHQVEALAREHGARVATTDYEAILDDADIDAVLIATRHDSHAALVIGALERGKHVFVEKPLCLTRTELATIEATVVRLGGQCPVLMTGFNRRFSPYATAVQSAIASRSNPLIVDYRVNAGYIGMDHWVHGPGGGGRNIGEACHFFDLIGFFASAPVATIQARSIVPTTASYVRTDNFAAILSFQDGSVGTLTYTALGHPDHPKEVVDLYSDGRVLRIADFEALSATGCKPKTVKGRDKGHAAELAAFRAAVQGKTPWPISFAEQAQAMRIAFDVEDALHVRVT